MQLDEIVQFGNQIFDLMVQYRRHFHQYPELGGQEFKTQEFILTVLEKEGISCEKIAETGVLAVVEGKCSGEVVAMRADIDALPIEEKNDTPYRSVHPGVMHACGHDAHTAIQLGCAKFFHEKRNDFKGAVKFFFQPAEENIGGAERMVAEGCLKNPDVDAVIGLHVMPYHPYDVVEIKYGSLNASTDTIVIKVKGKGGHGAYPDKCVDAILIASQIIVALQSVVSRFVSPLESAVFTAGQISGGTGSNIIADEVTIRGTVRASGLVLRDQIFRQIEQIAKGVARSMGGDCEIFLDEGGYLPLVNDDEIVDVIRDAAVEYLGKENVQVKPIMSMGGEDFSFFIENVKGAFYSVGCKIPGREDYILHTDLFDIDERCLLTGFVMEAYSAIQLLKQ